MSASEWRMCPFCEKEKERLKEVLTVNKYEEKMKDFLHPEHETEETIRVDWDFGIDDEGVFSFDYGADCAVCGAGWTFKIKDSEPQSKSRFEDKIDLTEQENKSLDIKVPNNQEDNEWDDDNLDDWEDEDE